MRSDMARVIVERPRIPAFKVRKGRALPLDDMPTRKGMRRGHAEHGDVKELNENLTPLRRYLESQVGRPWDKVYSEIAVHLRVDSAVQQHVREHLRDFVAVKPRRLNQGWRSMVRGALWWQRLYVDPVTGLLCRTDRLPEEKARHRRAGQSVPAAPVMIALAADRELRLIDGFWYEVRLAPLPEPEYRACRETRKLRLKPYGPSKSVEVELTVLRLVTPAVRDVVTGSLIEAGPVINDPASRKEYDRAHPDRRYAVAKRALSRREMRQHGLENMYRDG
jgi:hypothetical protein